MAFIATDSAESYNNGDPISGLNGGSDWSGAWSVSGAGTKDIVNTPTLQGSLCFHLRGTLTTEANALRSFANITSGQMSFMFRRDNNTDDAFILQVRESGTVRFSFSAWGHNNFGFGTGHFVLEGSSNTDLGTFSANTNYTIILDMDNATDQVRVSLNGGTTFSSWLGYVSAATNLSDLRFVESNASSPSVTRNGYFDDIKPYSTAVVTAAPDLASVPISGGISDSGGGMGI
jgi:hypothetical protein